MIKNISIIFLACLSLFLIYTMVVLRIGEPTSNVQEVTKENYKNNSDWTTYKSTVLGIEITHPKNLIVKEEAGVLTLKNDSLEFVISEKNNTNLNDLITWMPLTWSISSWPSDDKVNTHLVIRYEKEKLSDPIISAKHLIIKSYPTDDKDIGNNKDILIVDTVADDPLTYDIIDTIKFTN